MGPGIFFYKMPCHPKLKWALDLFTRWPHYKMTHKSPFCSGLKATHFVWEIRWGMAPSHPSSHRHLSPLPLQQPSHSSRQSRSLRRHSEPQETDKRSVPTHRSPRRRKISARHLRQSSRDFSPPRDRARSKDFCSLRGRESSITLKSASPIVRSDIMTRTMTTSTTLTIPLLDHLDHVHHHVGKNNTPPTMRLPMGIPSPGSLTMARLG